jgi:signal transduction histidine kinase
LRINADDGKLAISVEDNGCGFERPPADPGADGLRNMRQRVADIGGECSIHGQPGGGTTVSVKLPWSRIRNET